MPEIIIAAVVAIIAVVALVGFVVLPRGRDREAPAPEDLDEQARDLLEKREPRTTPPLPEADGAAPPLPQDVDPEAATAEQTAEAAQAEPGAPVAPPLSPRERFFLRLIRARNSLGYRIAEIFGRGLDEEAWEDLEDSLIAADVGMEATLELVEGLRDRCREEDVRTGDEALRLLKEILRLELSVTDRTLKRREDGTTVWLVTGVNGSGKTTSIGKVAARHVAQGETVVLAAADTFRAAAAEQLELWGERSGARVVRHGEGADPAAVAFDGWKAADQVGADLLLVDTAGRLQNKRELMDELSKVKRVLEKGAGPCDEVLLVLDATTGQNGLSQAKAFTDAVDVSGVVLTKLDGTAKGGIVIAIQRQLGIPVKLVGLGEDVDDLAEFDPDAFVEALFAQVAQEVDMAEVDMADPSDEPQVVEPAGETTSGSTSITSGAASATGSASAASAEGGASRRGNATDRTDEDGGPGIDGSGRDRPE